MHNLRHQDGTRRIFDDGRGITATDGTSSAPATTETGPVVVGPGVIDTGTNGLLILRPSEHGQRDISARLEYLRGELRAERISWGELVELQELAFSGHIPADDTELLEAAGVPEHEGQGHDDPHGEMAEAGYPAGH